MVDPSAPMGELRLRQPGRVIAAVALALVVASLVLTALNGQHHGAFFSAYSGVVLVTVISGMVTQLRAEIIADRSGVRARVQLFRRTRPLPWTEVHHFAARGYWRGLGAWTVDGRWVHLMVYGQWGGNADMMVHQLERYRWTQQRALGLV